MYGAAMDETEPVAGTDRCTLSDYRDGINTCRGLPLDHVGAALRLAWRSGPEPAGTDSDGKPIEIQVVPHADSRTLAHEWGMGHNSVAKIMAALVLNGWLRPHGRGRYVLTVPPLAGAEGVLLRRHYGPQRALSQITDWSASVARRKDAMAAAERRARAASQPDAPQTPKPRSVPTSGQIVPTSGHHCPDVGTPLSRRRDTTVPTSGQSAEPLLIEPLAPSPKPKPLESHGGSAPHGGGGKADRFATRFLDQEGDEMGGRGTDLELSPEPDVARARERERERADMWGGWETDHERAATEELAVSGAR